MDDKAHSLDETVIAGGYCVGCGACASLPNSSVSMKLDGSGKYFPLRRSRDDGASDLSVVCPFSDQSVNEDELAEGMYGGSALSFDPAVGFYDLSGAAWVTDQNSRILSSSGGIGTWLASRLLAAQLVDAIVHVKPENSGGQLFAYQVSRTSDEIKAGRSSRYYPVEMSQVLEEVRSTGERVAVFGLPCFVTALRLLCRQDAELSKQIRYAIGLVCGHMKTTGFGELLGAQLGVPPNEINSINFRKKTSGRPASQYSIEVGSKEHANLPSCPNTELYGTDWGHGFFKLKGCDFCDDIFAETADFVIGDAWLPEFSSDWRGTNVIVSRSSDLSAILNDGIDSGQVDFEELGPSELAKSQDANFRHRRAALPLRLKKADSNNIWRPKKRFEGDASDTCTPRKKLLDLRTTIAQTTRESWPAAKRETSPAQMLRTFRFQIDPLLERYAYLQHLSQNAPSSLKRRALDATKKIFMDAAYLLAAIVSRVLSALRLSSGIVILPPYQPGSLGDEAVMRSVLTEVKSRINESVTLFSYRQKDGWCELVGWKCTEYCIQEYMKHGSRKSILSLLIVLCTSRRLLICGTDVLDGHYSETDSVSRIRIAKIASSLGIQTRLIGFSFSEDASPLTRKEMRELGRDVEVFARDPISFFTLQSVVGVNVRLVADPAFLMQPITTTPATREILEWLHEKRKDGGIVLGLNINHLLLNTEPDIDLDSLIENFTSVLEQLLKRDANLRVCLLPHDNRGDPSDFDIAERLLSSLDPMLLDGIQTLPRNTNAAEVKGIVSQLDCVFTGKMHLAIAALGSGVPVGAIVYKDKKFLGLFTHFDLTDWLLPSASWKQVNQLIEFITRLLDSRAELAERIATQMPYIQELSRSNFENI